jgi:hypothetical protein
MQKKDRETKQQQKLFEDQAKKLKLLEMEVERLNTQKVTMMKKVKDEKEELS